MAKDVPYETAEPSLELEQPSVYFGEKLSSYVVTGTKQREIHYRGDSGTVYTKYDGKDGVKADNILKRAAFALRFGDPNLVISKQLTGS